MVGVVRFVIALSIIACAANLARAEAGPVRTFAIVVANNRSMSDALPDLQYADDDGARYQRLFHTVASPDDVALLTTFDRATRAEFPALAEGTRPPTIAALLAARDELARAVDQAHAQGQATALFVVYAGHGEMKDGRGLLDLEDGQIDGVFIERELLDALHTDTKHVLLDSCNSFFVMNPRSPGGRRWATPSDMAFGFSARHPEVGLFLSTNSESEVFEWSELESGVFSHEVRSGLSGGADVDADGIVTYVELAGFIDTANAGIARESLRPHLYYRGPNGDGQSALFSVAQMRGRRLVLDAAPARLWVKGETGERLLDVHKDQGPLSLVVPSAGEVAIFVQEGTSHPMVVEYAVPAGEQPIALGSLESQQPRLAQRGGRLFGELFRDAYGPAALSAFENRKVESKDDDLYGLSDSDVVRVHHYLTEFAEASRARRLRAGLATATAGALGLGGSIALAVRPVGPQPYLPVLQSSLFTAMALTTGAVLTLRPSPAEKVLRDFEADLESGGLRAKRALVDTERAVQRLLDRERRVRNTLFWVAEIEATGCLIAGSILLAQPAHGGTELQDRAHAVGITYSAGIAVALLGAALRVIDTPTERLLKLYREDVGVKMHFSGSVGASSASLGVSGVF